jgi:type VI secretion system protein ImpG
LETGKDRDPKMEALFEGFAFLCAGIRERVDEALPFLASGLTGLLWPQLLHPVAPLCIMEFRPRAGMLQGGHNIKKGTVIFTDTDPGTGVSCQFATTQDVCVNPIAISKVEVTTNAGGKDVLTLSFKIEQGVKQDILLLSPVKIFINDDLPTALLIRKMLLCHVEEVILKNDCGQSKKLIVGDTFIEGGFGENEDLFPESQNVSRPLSLLRDYFVYPEKFLFVDIYGLDSFLLNDTSVSDLSLEIRFDRKLSGKIFLTKEIFKLHCAPAINVFRRDAEPILVDGRKSEYEVVSDAVRPECYAIHSVESVIGIDRVTGERREYERYCQVGSDDRNGGDRFYSVRTACHSETNHQLDDGRRVMLSMNGRQTEDGWLKQETLHVGTWQTNGAFAWKILTEGGLLYKAKPDFPDFVTFTNLTIPSRSVNPPQNDKYLWTFLSHMSATHLSFSDAERLKDFLRAYDWTMFGDKRPEVESIQSVSIKPCDMAVDRAVMRGSEMIITVDNVGVPEENIFLLGAVLARSLSGMASINTFLKLVVTIPASGKNFVWHCRGGERWGM